jgi:hypothetical protein
MGFILRPRRSQRAKRLYIHSYILYIHQPADHCYENKIQQLLPTTYYYKKATITTTKQPPQPLPPPHILTSPQTRQEDKGIKEESSHKRAHHVRGAIYPYPLRPPPSPPSTGIL